MTQNQLGGQSFLDEIRKNEGNEPCKAVFKDICEKDKARAGLLLNDRRLTFPCLWLLMPQIEALQLDRGLSPRSAMALRIVRAISKLPSREDDVLSRRSDMAYAALKWILETGYAEDGLSEEYEELMEVVISVLISTYQDMKALPIALDMLFTRNRMGHNIHHLVWAAFQSRSPQVLKLIAQRMGSPDDHDARLACNLLGIVTPDGCEAAEMQKQYERFMKWLTENDPYLYFTGESFQFASRPAFYRVDQERKYIHRGTPSYDQRPIAPADESERNALAAFSVLGDDEKTLLSEYSHKIHQQNLPEWKAWVRRPIDEQINTAKLNREKLDDYGSRFFV